MTVSVSLDACLVIVPAPDEAAAGIAATEAGVTAGFAVAFSSCNACFWVGADDCGIGESAKNVLPYDVDQELVKEIQALSKKLDQLAAETEALASRPGLGAGAR